MKELSVFIEVKESPEGFRPLGWIALPINKKEFEERFGTDLESDNYWITDNDLPFSNEVNEDTHIDKLNELYEMYVSMPEIVQEETKALLTYFESLSALSRASHDFIFYETTDMEEVARIRTRNAGVSEKASKFIKYEELAERILTTRNFVQTNSGIFEIQ